MIICNNISKTYSKQLILNNISACFANCEISIILGASGSGKSTLLNIIAQNCSADTGTVAFKPLTPSSEHQQHNTKSIPAVGMVHQQYNLWPHLTILQNLTLAPIKVLKQSKSQAISIANNYLHKFALSDKAHHYPEQLSGGQQQRIAMIRSMLLPYNAIALDEPTAALDPAATSLVAKTLTKLKNYNKAIIVTTHHIEFAKQIADKVFFIKDGLLAESGNKDILYNPKTEDFKSFLTTGENT